MDEEQTIDTAQAQPAAAAPAAAAEGAGAVPAPVTPAAAPAPSVGADAPRRGPGRPKGKASKGKASKASKGKASKPSKPSKSAAAAVPELADDEDDEDTDELAGGPRESEPTADEPEQPETPEQRRERYAAMRARMVEHGPVWERRLALAEPLVALGIVFAAGSEVPAQVEYTMEVPTTASGSTRRVKLKGPAVVINALAQIIAAYSPDKVSEMVAHPCAPAAAALADLASAIVMARLAPLFGGVIQVAPQEVKDDGRQGSPVAALG